MKIVYLKNNIYFLIKYYKFLLKKNFVKINLTKCYSINNNLTLSKDYNMRKVLFNDLNKVLAKVFIIILFFLIIMYLFNSARDGLKKIEKNIYFKIVILDFISKPITFIRLAEIYSIKKNYKECNLYLEYAKNMFNVQPPTQSLLDKYNLLIKECDNK